MSCSFLTPLDCGTGILDGAANSMVNSVWDAICNDFASSASNLLKAFGQAFVGISNVDVLGGGVSSVYAMSMGIAGVVATILLIGQVVRTAFTHEGRSMALALTGLGKTALAFLLTLTLASASIEAANELSDWIVKKGFGSTANLSNRLMSVFSYDNGTKGALLLVLALVGLALTAVLWFELLVRNAALAVLVATSPIAAAGQMSQATASWWNKLVAAAIQLIILKPVIALVFTLGFKMAANSSGLESTLAGMLVLLLAAFAWPAVARFFTFASVQVTGATGLGAVLGFAAGRATPGGGRGTVGTHPDAFARQTETRTVGAASEAGVFGAAAPGAAGAPGATGAAGAAGSAVGTVGAGAAAAGLGPAGVVVAAAKIAQSAVNALAGKSEQTAGHAGLNQNQFAAPAGRAHGVPPEAAFANARAAQAQSQTPEPPSPAPPIPGEPESGGER